MACELQNGDGLSGEQLNDLVGALPLPDGVHSLDLSMLLAAYVTATDGPVGSRVSAALLGAVDTTSHATQRYPTVVVTLFSREVLLPLLTEAGAVHGFSASSRSIGADPCGAIGSFLDDLPAAAAGAVGSLSPAESGFWSDVVAVGSVIAGAAAYATAQAARSVIQHLPFVDAIRTAATAASAVADLRAMFTNWVITLTPQPGEVHKSVGGTNTGVLQLEVQPPEPGFTWPPQLVSCATLLNVPLPQFDSADGSSVEWTKMAGFDDPAYETAREATISGGTADFTFATVVEDEQVHTPGGPLQTRPATVSAQLGLPGLEHLGSTLAGAMGSTTAQVAIGAGAGPAATLLGPSISGSASITYHPADAVVDSDVGFEALHLSTHDAVSPEGVWTGTFRVVLGDTGGMLCGPAQEQAVTLSFSGGTASFNPSFSFGGGVMQSCTFDVTETLTLEPDGFGGWWMSSSGSYTSVMVPPPPAEQIITNGVRDESYAIEFVTTP
ncbi:MAG: hypothetical protein IT190_08135 [Microbacteriaceae bacterium]|nr:hypothetical protein [Microbacteriaceae bacterium]